MFCIVAAKRIVAADIVVFALAAVAAAAVAATSAADAADDAAAAAATVAAADAATVTFVKSSLPPLSLSPVSTSLCYQPPFSATDRFRDLFAFTAQAEADLTSASPKRRASHQFCFSRGKCFTEEQIVFKLFKRI